MKNNQSQYIFTNYKGYVFLNLFYVVIIYDVLFINININNSYSY